jgi:hypothetical protein
LHQVVDRQLRGRFVVLLAVLGDGPAGLLGTVQVREVDGADLIGKRHHVETAEVVRLGVELARPPAVRVDTVALLVAGARLDPFRRGGAGELVR